MKDLQYEAALSSSIQLPQMTRRKFVSLLGAGAATVLLPDWSTAESMDWQARTAPPAIITDMNHYLHHEERYFKILSRMFLVNQNPPYFAIGQKGSMARPVLDQFHQGLNQIARDPFPVYLEPSATTRSHIAAGYGAQVDEIAISRNTTDAISQILNGIDWKAGDEVLASTMEYPNCVATLLRVAQRWSLSIRQFGVPMAHDTTSDEVIDAIQRQIKPGVTKVIFFSCPMQPSGILMPARKIAALAQEYGIITVVDGAHYGGQFVPKLNDTGIDFMGISGHKWQCGPGGTGILYARNALHPANSSPLPRFYLIRTGDLSAPTDGSRPDGFDIGAALSLYGFPESADWRALGQASLLWDQIGRKRIEDYIMVLGDYMRQKLTETFGDQAIMQPMNDPELKSGIICFNPFPEPEQRKDASLCEQFAELIYEDYGYRIGHGGLGPTGLTRAPDPEAREFPEGCIPNRDPVTNAPAPTDYPFRIDSFIWITRRDVDEFVEICKRLLDRLIIGGSRSVVKNRRDTSRSVIPD